jgi:hypothetical protein
VFLHAGGSVDSINAGLWSIPLAEKSSWSIKAQQLSNNKSNAQGTFRMLCDTKTIESNPLSTALPYDYAFIAGDVGSLSTPLLQFASA